MRVIWLVVLVAIATVSQAKAEESSVLSSVTESGVLKVGVRTSIPLFGFTDEDGEIVGFDVDIAKAIATSIGVDIELVPVTGATRISMLNQGRIDMAAAALGIYKSREEEVDFSIPYVRTPLTVLTKKKSSIRSLADLAGKRVGTDIGSGTTRQLPEVQPEATIQTFEGWPEAFLALERGFVDALATDIVILSGLRANAQNSENYVLLGPKGHISVVDWGIAVPENDSDWRDAVNFALQDIYRSGQWEQIFNKWLGSDSKLKLSPELLDFKMAVWP